MTTQQQDTVTVAEAAADAARAQLAEAERRLQQERQSAVDAAAARRREWVAAQLARYEHEGRTRLRDDIRAKQDAFLRAVAADPVTAAHIALEAARVRQVRVNDAARRWAEELGRDLAPVQDLPSGGEPRDSYLSRELIGAVVRLAWDQVGDELEQLEENRDAYERGDGQVTAADAPRQSLDPFPSDPEGRRQWLRGRLPHVDVDRLTLDDLARFSADGSVIDAEGLDDVGRARLGLTAGNARTAEERRFGWLR